MEEKDQVAWNCSNIRNTETIDWIGRVAEDRGDEPSVTANGSTRCFCCSFLAYSCGREILELFFFLAVGSVA